ncbi:hypothetical protein ACNR9V_20250 (plasmid) [Parageobacillus thermoglucosidasius]|uniref:hypothetical protein n=1 Tax=Parageobacillus thermoglucosidasius TaxID=1426 RepID=UPI003B685FB7
MSIEVRKRFGQTAGRRAVAETAAKARRQGFLLAVRDCGKRGTVPVSCCWHRTGQGWYLGFLVKDLAGQKAQETETWDSRTVVFAHSVMAPSCHPAGGLRGSVWPFAKMAGRWRRPVSCCFCRRSSISAQICPISFCGAKMAEAVCAVKSLAPCWKPGYSGKNGECLCIGCQMTIKFVFF